MRDEDTGNWVIGTAQSRPSAWARSAASTTLTKTSSSVVMVSPASCKRTTQQRGCGAVRGTARDANSSQTVASSSSSSRHRRGTHLDAKRRLVRFHRLEDIRDVHGAVRQQEAEGQAGAGEELRGGAQRALDERLRSGQRRL